MAEKIIILTSNDEIQTEDYTDYNSLQNAVEGSIKHFNTLPNVQLVPIDPPIKVDMWCNEEFANSDKESCKRLNTIATALNGGNLIYGNVALTVLSPEGEQRGFRYSEKADGKKDICECYFMEDRLLHMRKGMEQDGIIADLHAQFDHSKPKTNVEIAPTESCSKKDVGMEAPKTGNSLNSTGIIITPDLDMPRMLKMDNGYDEGYVQTLLKGESKIAFVEDIAFDVENKTTGEITPVKMTVAYLVNKDALFSDDESCKRINGLGTLLAIKKDKDIYEDKLMFGNVVVVPFAESGDEQFRTFTDTEAKGLYSQYNRIRNVGMNKITELHKQYDGHRPEGKVEMITYGKNDFVFDDIPKKNS